MVVYPTGGAPQAILLTPLIIRDCGMEGSGLLGTLLFLFLGLPGLATTVVGLFVRD